MTPTKLGPIADVDGSRVRVGTCSWTDPTLVEDSHWYPRRSMSAAERLAFYAEHFPVAEADSTYYFPPAPQLTRGWAERTPPGFSMDVKAYSLLTGHPTKPKSLWSDIRVELEADEHQGNVYAHHLTPEQLDEAWARFNDALDPLDTAGKLGGVLLQYPTWFTPKRENRAALAAARSRLGTRRAFVELRAPAWLRTPEDRDRTLGLLREHDLTHVVVDAPESSGLEPVVAATTEDIAVIRMHGRNDDTWSRRTGTAAERFRYLYDEGELREWLPRIAQLAESAREVHVLMNNCYQDYGVRNAEQLAAQLGAGTTDAPRPGADGSPTA